MQSINLTVLNPGFFVCSSERASRALRSPFYGRARGGAGRLLVGGCVLYVVGSIGVTRYCNVQLNEALAAVNPGTAEAAALWRST